MPITFRKATKTQGKLRMALDGPSGSGKTYTALLFATALADGGRVAMIDTERGSSAKYSDIFDFDVVDMREVYPHDPFDPANYIECIHIAEEAGYGVIIVDSLSHAWEGEGGALDQHDNAIARYQGNSWAAWRDVTPTHRRLVDTILQSPAHIFVTMRSKTEYVQDKDERGRVTIRKVGMAPIQRPGMEYEFDVVASMDWEHRLMVGKSRCSAVDGATVHKPTAEWFALIKGWLEDGAQPPEPQPAPHWADDEETSAKFFEWAASLGLMAGDALDALQVDELRQYPGSKTQAFQAVKKYAAARRGAEGLEQTTAAAAVVDDQETML